jgi:ribosomal protein L4
MAQVQVYNQEGRKTSKMELADSIFAYCAMINPQCILPVVSYLAATAQGTTVNSHSL